MAIARRPIRSPRALYKITLVDVHLDDDDDAIDPAPTQTVAGTKRAIVVNMKEAVGDYLSLQPMAWNDPLFFGTFKTPPAQTGATNAGAEFYRRLGGYKEASYTFEAMTKFTISEIAKSDNGYSRSNADFRTFSIGFPRGHSVIEIIRWIAGNPRFNDIRAIVTPNGRRIALKPVD